MAILHPAPWLACNQQCQDPAASSSGCHFLLWYWFKALHCHWCTKQRVLWELHLHKINLAWNKWTVFGEAEWQRLERLSLFRSLLASGVMVCSWSWPLTSLEGGQFLHNIFKFYFKNHTIFKGNLVYPIYYKSQIHNTWPSSKAWHSVSDFECLCFSAFQSAHSCLYGMKVNLYRQETSQWSSCLLC